MAVIAKMANAGMGRKLEANNEKERRRGK